jgi:hypothetical protein
LTTELQTDSLKTAPDKDAPNVVEASWFDATAILDCKGDWLRIEVPLSTKDRTLKPKLPSDGPANTVRGWAWGRLSCTQQRTTCDFGGVLPSVGSTPVVWPDEANRTKCLTLPDEPNKACTVEQFDRLGSVDVTMFDYAMYRYADPQSRVLDYHRVVILEDDSGTLRQLFATPGDPSVRYDTPQIIKLADRTLLQIPGHDTGTGNLNREELFVWHDGNWGKADTASWLDDLADRLPAGLAVGKGVYPDYTTMTAETPLWRKGDANACPTGGRAKISLDWQADRVVLHNVRVERAGECGEPLP